jgi:hypothetical protein
MKNESDSARQGKNGAHFQAALESMETVSNNIYQIESL